MEPSHNPAKKNWGGFGLRVVSSLVILPLCILPIWAGGIAFEVFLALVLALSAYEWSLLSGVRSKTFARVFAVGMTGTFIIVQQVPLENAVVWVLGVSVLAAVRGRSLGYSASALLMFGVLYLLSAFCLAGFLRHQEMGLHYILWLAAMVIATDVGAYISGKTIGGPKIWYRLSPGKTWAGLFGGVLCAAAASSLINWQSAGLDVIYLLIGGVIAVVAQTGDFLESWLKRRVGVKDSSSLIPGHGGILDRIDGFLAATIVFGAVVWLFDGGLL